MERVLLRSAETGKSLAPGIRTKRRYYVLNNYQSAACKTFKEHTELDPRKARLMDWGSGLGGETGEVLELLKHHVFHDAPLDKMEIAKELGDVMWYVAALATTLDMKMSDIADLNVSKLEHRHQQKFSVEASANRHAKEEAFKDSDRYKAIRDRICKPVPISVIFVGPDGSGKTTLSKQVAKELEYVYHKCNYEQEDKVNLSEHLLSKKENTIFDRFYWPDDIIYTTLHAGKAATNFHGAYGSVIKSLMEGNTLFILVDADIATLEKRSAQWADDYIKTEQLDMLQEAYGNLMMELQDQYNLPVLYLNTSGVETDSTEYYDLVDHCVAAINMQQKRYAKEII